MTRRPLVSCALMLCLAAAPLAAQSPTVVQAASSMHALVLLNDGTVLGWGVNNAGQLGKSDGATMRRFDVTVPFRLPLPGKVTQIAVSSEASYAVLEDGSVLAFGYPFKGALGAGATTQTKSPNPAPVRGLSSVRHIAAASNTVLVALADGTVWGWGNRNSGLLGDGASEPTQFTPVQVRGVSDVAEVSISDAHAMARTTDGRVFAWGSNRSGELGIGTPGPGRFTPSEIPGLPAVVSIAAGLDVSAAVTQDGTVWTWGSNSMGGLGTGRDDEEVVPAPRKVAGISGAVAVRRGSAGRHTMVLLKNGTLVGWGNSDWGQLGAGISGDFQRKPTPVKLPGVEAFWVSGNNTFARTKDGTFWMWGNEFGGQGPLKVVQKLPVRFPPEWLTAK